MMQHSDFSSGTDPQNGAMMIGATEPVTKVLIVDDEPDIVEEVIEQLEDQGLSCLSAFNAKSAMELLRTDPSIGVVVTDIRMPGMDGLEMSRQIKATATAERDVFIIVMTGHAGMKEAVEALQLGAEDFLTKPISPDHLLHSVRRAGEMIHLRQHERSFQEQLQREVKLKTADLDATNQKLIAANQIKDQFLSVMGHELRTPLNAINGFAELLQIKLKGASDPSIADYLDHIIQSGNRLSTTIENILEFSSTISGSRKAKVEWQSMEDVFGNVLGHFDKQATDKGIRLEQAALAGDQLVAVDSAMLIKALTCLIDNAIKFSPSNSVVTIGAEKTADALTCFIRDQGCGMTADEIELARQPLSQVDNGLTRTAEGAGLGLSLAVLLSELQGGRLDIESTPDEGTTVRIVLPQPKDKDGRSAP